MTILLISFSHMDAKAAGSVTIFLDKTELTADEELRVTVQTSEPEDDAVQPEVVLNYDSSLLEFEYCSGEYGGGEGGLITFKGTKANLSFIAKKDGTASLEAEAVIDEDGNNKATATKSVTITGGRNTQESSVTEEDIEDTLTDTSQDNSEDEENSNVEERELSSDANLKKFNLTEAKIEPKFNKNHMEYTITLEENMPQLAYTAKTSSKKAKMIALSGFSNLKNGSNKAVLNVKAEDGTIKAYYFTIIKEGEAASTEDTQPREAVEAVNGMIPVADSELAVNTTFPTDFLPDGCIKVDYVYKEQVVEAAFFEQGEVMLLYLTKQDGSQGDFYIYYSGTDEFMDFIQIKGSEGQFVFPVQFPVGVVIPDRFSDSSMQWGEKTVPAFMVSTSESEYETDSVSSNEETQIAEAGNLNPTVALTDFYLLYAMNQDGKEGFYLYDTLEGTYQRYLELTSYEEETGGFDEESYVVYKNKSQQRMVVIGVLIVIIVILVFVLLNMFLSLKELKEQDEEEDDEEEEQATKAGGKKRLNNFLTKKEPKEKSVKEKSAKEKTTVKNQTTDKKEIKKDKTSQKVSKPKIKKESVNKNVFEQIEEMEEMQKASIREERVEKKPVRKPIMYDLSSPKIDGSLTPKMQREQLDDDFEFEFIKIDDED